MLTGGKTTDALADAYEAGRKAALEESQKKIDEALAERDSAERDRNMFRDVAWTIANKDFHEMRKRAERAEELLGIKKGQLVVLLTTDEMSAMVNGLATLAERIGEDILGALVYSTGAKLPQEVLVNLAAKIEHWG